MSYIRSIFIFYLCFIQNIYSFVLPDLFTPFLNTLHNNNIITNNNICPDNLYHITKNINEPFNHLLVKQITGVLPFVDSIAGFILHTNDTLINNILNNAELTLETKKTLILILIEFSQNGDNTGSQLLQLYHDLVSCLL